MHSGTVRGWTRINAARCESLRGARREKMSHAGLAESSGALFQLPGTGPLLILSCSCFEDMLRFIRKHQLLGGALLFLVLASFIVFMAPDAGQGGGRPKFDLGSYQGKKVSREEYVVAYNEARLSFFLMRGEWPGSSNAAGFDLEREALRRLISIRNQKKYGIEVPDEAVVRRIRRLFADPETGEFRQTFYSNVLATVAESPGNIPKQRFYDAIRHDIGEEQLQRIVTVAGAAVSPEEVKLTSTDSIKMADTKVVVFDSQSLTNQLSPSAEAFREYYTNNLARYRTQETIAAAYVEFAFTNYLEVAEPVVATNEMTDILIDQRYSTSSADEFVDDEGNPLDEEAAKARIRSELVETEAQRFAQRNANRFIEALILSEKPKGLATFKEIAAENELEVGETEPLQNFMAPTSINAPRQFTQEVFNLTADSPYTREAIEGEDAYYVATAAEKIPSRPQTYEEVAARVESDWRRERLSELAREAGEAFYAKATNSLATGGSFESVATTAGKEVIEPELFNQQTRSFSNAVPGVSIFRLKPAIQQIAPGEVTPYVSSGTDGFVAYLESLEEPEDSEMVSEQMETASNRLRGMRQSAFYLDWIERELVNSKLKLARGEEE